MLISAKWRVLAALQRTTCPRFAHHSMINITRTVTSSIKPYYIASTSYGIKTCSNHRRVRSCGRPGSVLSVLFGRISFRSQVLMLHQSHPCRSLHHSEIETEKKRWHALARTKIDPSFNAKSHGLRRANAFDDHYKPA